MRPDDKAGRNSIMKTTTQCPHKKWAVAVILGLIAVIAGILVVRPPNGGNGDGLRGSSAQPDLGDLFILKRNNYGVPELSDDACRQPLAAPGVSLLPSSDGKYPGCTPASGESCVIPVDPATCAVVLGYETFTQKVDFGRTSVVRSPIPELETQLEDVVSTLASADCISLDAAGRLVASTVAGDVVISTAIDSPLQNLAIYRQLMLKGYLGAENAQIELPDHDNPMDVLNTAARGLGASFDKTGKIGVDTVVYLNQILGLTDENVQTLLPKHCVEVKEEVEGVVKTVRKCFLDYGPTGGAYDYRRGANFGFLPAPAYIPGSPATPKEGWFEYLGVSGSSVPGFVIAQGPILAAVPELAADPALTGSNIGGFVLAADDARAVIDFMHTWPVPGDSPTPLKCAASGESHYDVSISDESGLQVPERMAAGTEGREFTVVVANAGPDTAAGTVTVTAVDASGVGIPTFPRTFNFTGLQAGANQSWTEGFSIDKATTVTWTASATPECGLCDSDPVNNIVTETVQVANSQEGGVGSQGGKPN